MTPISHSIRLQVVLTAVLCCALSPVLAAETGSGVVSKVKNMEQCMFGKAHLEMTLNQRLNALESKAFGKPQPGSVAKRVEALQKVIGSKSSMLLPPIAPQLDTGVTAPKLVENENTTAHHGSGAHQSTQDKTPRLQRPHRTAAAHQVSQDRVRQLLHDGMDKHQAGKTDEAEKIFKDVLIASPYNAHASFNLGAISEERGDLAAALGHYRTALIADPNDTEVQQAVAQIEEEISKRQDGPIRNPLQATTTASNGHVLRGNAWEFEAAQQPIQPVMAPVIPYTVPNQPAFNGNAVIGQAPIVHQPVPTQNVSQRRGHPVLKAVTRAAITAGISGALRINTGSSFGNAALGGLRCPLCRMLRF